MNHKAVEEHRPAEEEVGKREAEGKQAAEDRRSRNVEQYGMGTAGPCRGNTILPGP